MKAHKEVSLKRFHEKKNDGDVRHNSGDVFRNRKSVVRRLGVGFTARHVSLPRHLARRVRTRRPRFVRTGFSNWGAAPLAEHRVIRRRSTTLWTNQHT